MNENNFESLNEQQIAELYGDVLEEPTLIAGAVDTRDGCRVLEYCHGDVVENTYIEKWKDRTDCDPVWPINCVKTRVPVYRTDYHCVGGGGCRNKIVDLFD